MLLHINSAVPPIKTYNKCATSEIIKADYAAPQLECFFTAGPDEVHALPTREGTEAAQAARKILTDFIMEVMKFPDLKRKAARTASRRQGIGSYIAEESDIIFSERRADMRGCANRSHTPSRMKSPPQRSTGSLNSDSFAI
ncbi:obg-like ATPase 1 [Dunckerocampus dactyliophorus]|uniref:obg-like ATPase 1 n=1 Tax=Dunckerocampus dactyliophorus TaxID=161453 RepID=UPI002405F5B8|nr:obg-like ATPase 1 [Dunckerocampus dactyliophorus]